MLPLEVNIVVQYSVNALLDNSYIPVNRYYIILWFHTYDDMKSFLHERSNSIEFYMSADLWRTSYTVGAQPNIWIVPSFAPEKGPLAYKLLPKPLIT